MRCRLKGAAIAAIDGLNFPVKDYAREAAALADVPLDAFVASLRASGLPAFGGGASGGNAVTPSAATV